MLHRSFCLFLFFIAITSFSVAQNINRPTELYFRRHAPAFEKVDLYWKDNSNNETGFEIYQKKDGGNWTLAGTVNAGTKSYTTTVNGNWSYEWRVRAINNSASSDYSNTVRGIGKLSKLEVYPEVPGIRNPKNHTINGITFSELADQCPAQPGQGKATRVSTFYSVQVRTSSGNTWKNSPIYEVRPQIRDQRVQNDPAHSANGHDVYAYGKYGPSSNAPGRTLHSRHWTNFDAEEEVVVRITLLNGAKSQTINLSQLEIHPAPISRTLVNSSTVDVTLPAAGNDKMDFARHYMITFNRDAWEDPVRGANIYEHPLMVFVNPVKPNPGSAPEGTYKEFDNGKLLIVGPGIHLPDNHLRFFGAGENDKAEEVYVPGDAYMHGGYCLNNKAKEVRIWGRGIYSDELFFVHQENDNWTKRTPWADMQPAEGNTWGQKGTWEASIYFKGGDYPQTVEGLSSISRRMGSSTEYGGNGRLIDHKDVGYAGGLYQKAGNSKTYYLGIYTHNDDDITYCHEDYEMHYSTTRILHNGPSFQFGWAVNNHANAGAKVYNLTVLPADKLGGGYWHNHGVFNCRNQAGAHTQHSGGIWENVHLSGTESIVFNFGISADKKNQTANKIGFFQDKFFKNFTIDNHSRNDNLFQTEIVAGTNQESYIRFLHFDNLVIAGNKVNHIDDGDFFDYNEKATNNGVNNGVVGGTMNGTLLHTITFFSLPNKASQPTGISTAVGKTITLASKSNNKFIQADNTLPQSLSPLCANSGSNTANKAKFQVVDAGDGYIALKANSGYFVKADPNRYGYIFTLPDELRGDADTKQITDEARFIWTDLGGGEFALYSKAMGLYIRAEQNCGPEKPLYAASNKVGVNETFTSPDYDSPSGTCTGNDIPSAEITSKGATCGEENGAIDLSFHDTEGRSEIEFSINGGNTYPTNVADNIGNTTIQNLKAGVYHVFARWGNDECPVDLGKVTISGADDIPTATVSTTGAICGEKNGSMTFTFPDNVERTGIEFSIDGGVTYPNNVPDNSGSTTFDNLPGGEYRVYVRWGNDECPVDLGNTTISGADDIPTATVSTTGAICGEENGSLTFTFPDKAERTGIEFSIDGGKSYLPEVKDNSGTSTVSNLSEGIYKVFARWGNMECPRDLGEVNLGGEEALEVSVLEKEDAICGKANASITLVFPDHTDRTNIEFSTDGGIIWPIEYNVKDNVGTFKIDKLSEGVYEMWARWGDDACPAKISDVTLECSVITGTTLGNKNQEGIHIFPTVTKDFIYIQFSPEMFGREFSIMNANGILAKTIISVSENQRVDLTDLPSGMYIINIYGVTTRVIKL